jgi:F-type H+-transporting ATPase subunit h
LYLKELKAYKAPVVKDSDATGHVQTFVIPKTPNSPEEANLAESLKEYESMAVEVEGQEAEAVAADGQTSIEDWLEDEDDEHGKGH